MENVLVTGGAGFIGSALVRALLADEEVERIVVVDNFDTGSRDNLAGLERERIEVHDVDIRDFGRLEPLFAGIGVVFHEAAVASVPRSIQEPVLCHEVNVDGTFNVLRAATHKEARRVVFAASSAAYGNAPEQPKREDMKPEPESPYAVHKLAGEYYSKTFFDSYGLETVALRYFNVFGPRQAPGSPYSGVLSILCDRILSGKPPRIDGDGEQSRDFIYVDDVVRLNILAARTPGAAGKVYNGGRGEQTTLNEAWAALQRIEGVDLPATHGPPRAGDVRHSVADISRARAELGFEPQVEIEEGLRRTLAWRRSARG